MLDFMCLYLVFNGHIACPELVSGESRNLNHPSVRRLRHALTAVRTGSISSVYICFSMVRWNALDNHPHL